MHIVEVNSMYCVFYIDHLSWMWSRSSSPYFVIYKLVSNLMNWRSLKQSETCILIQYCWVYNFVQFYNKCWSKWTMHFDAVLLSTILSSCMINVGPWININHVFSFGIVVFIILSNFMIIQSLKQSEPWMYFDLVFMCLQFCQNLWFVDLFETI